jgi:hypothetical protein
MAATKSLIWLGVSGEEPCSKTRLVLLTVARLMAMLMRLRTAPAYMNLTAVCTDGGAGGRRL